MILDVLPVFARCVCVVSSIFASESCAFCWFLVCERVREKGCCSRFQRLVSVCGSEFASLS